ncbi:MAG TPA: hypothetical protein VHB73_06460 [Alphaproteobacteria bacterium]|nr:hypothetical protein [Alphaproteobacteria bacterium]
MPSNAQAALGGNYFPSGQGHSINVHMTIRGEGRNSVGPQLLDAIDETCRRHGGQGFQTNDGTYSDEVSLVRLLSGHFTKVDDLERDLRRNVEAILGPGGGEAVERSQHLGNDFISLNIHVENGTWAPLTVDTSKPVTTRGWIIGENRTRIVPGPQRAPA